MRGWLRRLWSSEQPGDDLIVVTGLPRSGTSMMMRMLEAGGFPVAAGRAVELEAHQLYELPVDRYRVILMVRDLDEVLADPSNGAADRDVPDAAETSKRREALEAQLIQLTALLQRRHVPVVEVFYADALRDPRSTAENVASFVGRPLALDRMAAAVDPPGDRARL